MFFFCSWNRDVWTILWLQTHPFVKQKVWAFSIRIMFFFVWTNIRHVCHKISLKLYNAFLVVVVFNSKKTNNGYFYPFFYGLPVLCTKFHLILTSKNTFQTNVSSVHIIFNKIWKFEEKNTWIRNCRASTLFEQVINSNMSTALY